MHDAKGQNRERWESVLLDRLAKRGSGHTPDKKHPEYWNGTIKWVSLADSPLLDKVYIENSCETITAKGIANSSAVLHPPGTVILSRDAGVGKSAIMKSEMAVSQHFMSWTCGPELDNHFLYYWLQSYKPEFERVANGTTIKTIGLPYFRALKICKPPLPEQRAISQALGDIDALISALDRLIAKKRDIKQATMQLLLTGKTRLPGFKGNWKITHLNDCAKFCPGTYLSQKEYTDGPFEIQGAGSTMGTHVEANFHVPLTVIGRVGTVGRPRFMPSGCWVNNNAGAIIANQASATPFFIHLILSTMDWSKATSVTAQPFLVIDSLLKMEFMLPEMPEQAAISTVLSDMDTELSALETRRDKTRALKQGMMQELLSGKTRLI
jgi:type I restriction enzyme S subunit